MPAERGPGGLHLQRRACSRRKMTRSLLELMFTAAARFSRRVADDPFMGHQCRACSVLCSVLDLIE